MIKQYEQMSSTISNSAGKDKGHNGILLLHQVEHHIKDYQEQVNSMLHSAKAAQKAFKELLDMKQKQANIEEAQLARVHTEVAADQSRAVMIFTIFTIIFLPLSFFASVFGINAKEWSGVESNLALHTIFLYMGTISLAVILLSLLVAFNKSTRRLARTMWRRGARPLRRRVVSIFGFWRGSGEVEHDKVRLVEEALKGRRLETSPGRRPKRQWTKIFWDEDIGHKIFG